ncbi:MAG: hypothetical protein K9H64_19820 [Bacteroidales bacterium]|nr:hypothetical protein [Bacteroidales bacterium]MCF8458334.1 hypothetical protein [Bacteroidales bacterium]
MLIADSSESSSYENIAPQQTEGFDSGNAIGGINRHSEGFALSEALGDISQQNEGFYSSKIYRTLS